jgi:hypothetical protein
VLVDIWTPSLLNVLIIVEFKPSLCLCLQDIASAIADDHEKNFLLVFERESQVLDAAATLSRGNICRYQDLLGLLTVEAVPNTNDIICRASD